MSMENRSIDRNMDRNMDRSMDRCMDRNMDRNTDRSMNRSMDNRRMENRSVNNRPCAAERSREELMSIISRVSFAMDDTRLFLDTHPDCVEAMEYFKKMQHIRHEAMREYTERFGAMYGYNMGNHDTWTWNQGTPPWRMERKEGCR